MYVDRGLECETTRPIALTETAPGGDEDAD